MQHIIHIVKSFVISKSYNLHVFGIHRTFSLISSKIDKKKKRYNVHNRLYSEKHGMISEERMKELLQNRNFIVTSETSQNSNCLNFTVCSYNILAQYQLNNNSYLYTHCEADVLEWPMRWHNIKNDIERLNCDIYCLQEVQCDHYHEDIEPVMNKMGYKGFLSSKTGKKRDGCAIFIKVKTFDCELSTFETVNFHHAGIPVLSTDNVGQVALLSPNDRPDNKLCIANTHLFFNPNRGEIKLAEISLLFSRIDAISNTGQNNDRQTDHFYWPIIFCGDLNSEPTSNIYKFLANGHFDLNNIVASDISGQNKTSFWGEKSHQLLSCKDLPPRIGISDRLVLEDVEDGSLGTGVLSHLLRLRSAYVYSTRDKPRLVTAFTNADTCAVDFIFYRDLKTKSVPYLELDAYLELLTSDQFFSFGGIPNNQHGSDHIPIVAKFSLHV